MKQFKAFSVQFGVQINASEGLALNPHPEETIKKVRAELATYTSAELTALEQATERCKSLIVATQLLRAGSTSLPCAAW